MFGFFIITFGITEFIMICSLKKKNLIEERYIPEDGWEGGGEIPFYY